MFESNRLIAHSSRELASIVPAGTLEAVAAAILVCSTSTLRAEIAKRVPHHQHRDLALAFVDCWQKDANDVDARTVSVALHTAALSVQAYRDSQSVELVWTGPATEDTPFRRTEQAILQVLDAAKSRITLVSFAVYKIPNIGKALAAAAKRGVRLTIIVETPDKIHGEDEYNTIRALGPEVTACSTVYFWPKENRAVSKSGSPGLMHVKCAVADSEWLFLSSANLTEQAFTINMELGVLLRGGTMPKRVEQQFDGLIQEGQLTQV